MINNIDKETNRRIYIDVLRVFATFAVIILHVSSSVLTVADVRSYEYMWLNIYDSISRWGVPVFVMISGSLFLSKDIPIGKIHKKYMLRIVTAFAFWSLFYALFYSLETFELMEFLKNCVNGAVHLWFMFMILGLYLAIPILKKIVESERIMKYFLVLGFVFSFVIPQILQVISYFNEPIAEIFSSSLGMINFDVASTYTFYFVLGYYLHTKEIPQKCRILIYILGLLGFISTIIFSKMISVYNGLALEDFYVNSTVGVAFEAISLFVFCKYVLKNVSPNYFTVKILPKVSQCCFGVYLVHIFYIIVFMYYNITPLSFNPLLSVPVLSFAVFIISFCVSFILNKIPFVNKYIV